MRTSTGNDYLERLNRVMDYICGHLPGDLSVRRLARVAAFSLWHFHRLFVSLTGESVAGFIARVRMERAVFCLVHQPRKPVKAIAAECGYDSPAVFSRAFKAHHGFAPSRFDRGEWQKRTNCKVPELANPRHLSEFPAMSTTPLKVTTELRKEIPFVSIRVTDPYRRPHALAEAWGRLREWLDARGMDTGRLRMIGMSMDDPDITPLEKCRYDCGWIVPAGHDLRPARDIRTGALAAGLYAIHECRGGMDAVEHAWDWLFKHWLPRSGCQPVHQPACEIYHSVPPADGSSFHLDCCIPIERISV